MVHIKSILITHSGYQGSGVSHQVEEGKPVILESLVPLAGERAADGDDEVRPHQVEVHWQRTESCKEKRRHLVLWQLIQFC